MARARRAVSTSSKPPSIVHDGQSGACGHGSTSAGGRGGVKGWAFGVLARRVRGGAAARVSIRRLAAYGMVLIVSCGLSALQQALQPLELALQGY